VKVTKRDVGTVGYLPLTISSSCLVFFADGERSLAGLLEADAILEI